MNPVCTCGCTEALGATVHAIASALAEDDLDRAIQLGLLEATPCAGCRDACRARVAAARDTRLHALSARERFRACQARLQRRAEERAAARTVSVPVASTPDTAPALPSAAAAALARAKARAAERRKP
jgi:hypothetical protein